MYTSRPKSKLFQAVIFCCLAGISFFLVACTGSGGSSNSLLNVDYLIDNWQVVRITLPDMAEKDFPDRASFDTYLQTRATMQNLTAKDLQMEIRFLQDSQMETATMNEIVSSIYYLDGKSLFMIVEGTPPEKYDVLDVKQNSMVLRLLDKTINNNFIDMHLERR